jgi:uncharacterized protein with NRDE domain
MCLIALSVPEKDGPWVVIANRDESLARPTQSLHVWDDGSGIIAGRDLSAGGTWMGMAPSRRRIAMVTNVRDPADLRAREAGERSRGALVSDFLIGASDAASFVMAAHRYDDMRGFNLIAMDDEGAHWSSNRGGSPTKLTPGVHGVSNALLDTPWPKVVRAKAALQAQMEVLDTEALFSILADEHVAEDASLPDTGVGLALERVLSPIRIVADGYGTRCSTVIVVRDGVVTMTERTLAPVATGDVVFERPWSWSAETRA